MTCLPDGASVRVAGALGPEGGRGAAALAGFRTCPPRCQALPPGRQRPLPCPAAPRAEGSDGKDHTFTYDRVFGPEAGQPAVFEEVADLVQVRGEGGVGGLRSAAVSRCSQHAMGL